MYMADINTVSIPEQNLMMNYLQLDETELDNQIQALNAPCEQLVSDLLPNVTIQDGTWQTLKTEYIIWQMWRNYNNPEFAEKSEKAKADFAYFIDIVRDNKHKQQVLANQNDMTKTKGILIV